MALSKAARRYMLCENSFLNLNTFTRRQRSEWVNEVCLNRDEHGEYHHLFPVLRRNEEHFMRYTRMSIATFDYVLSKVQTHLEKQTTNWRKPIGPEERLVVTLRYLATGASFRMLAYSFRMGCSTVKKIVIETCQTIWEQLAQEHMPVPSTDRLKQSKQGYWDMWNFPNCVGALDGKHCRIKCPPQSGSKYFNYKKFFSVVLQAVSDPEYKFIAIDVGAKGSQNDGGTFAASSLCANLENNAFNMPPDSELPESPIKLPNVIIADAAYPLKTYLLKPYAGKNLTPAKTTFNYSLSRARRCVECAFGILYSKWRILGKDIETSVPHAITTIKCACVLHNGVRDKDGANDPVFRELRFNGRPATTLHTHRRNNRYTTKASDNRDKFANYLKTQRLLKYNV